VNLTYQLTSYLITCNSSADGILYCPLYRLARSKDDAAEADLSELVAVDFDIEWTAITAHFDFDVDLDTSVLCDAIAREPWSPELFRTLRAYVSLC